MNLAVIKTGGKQYIVKEGDNLKIEKIDKKIGGKINFEEILLVSDKEGKGIKIGNPFIDGVKVQGEIIEQGKNKKVVVVKYKSKTRYKRTLGHRQNYTKVKITKV
ncbi:50S ribosomal protein L21 [Candidatus Parcubacteria bacterium]|nr:50S ribosomal protein L21 [Candidatus Parcubacteria bacterium]